MKSVFLFVGALSFISLAACAQEQNTSSFDPPSFEATRVNLIKNYVRDLNAFNEAGVVTAAGVLEGRDAFWVAVGKNAAAEIMRIDARTGEMRPFFDTKAVKKALTKAGAEKAAVGELSLAGFKLINGGDSALFVVGESRLVLDLKNGVAQAYSLDEFETAFPRLPRHIADQFPGMLPAIVEKTNDAADRFVGVDDNNLYVRDSENGNVRQLTSDGERWHSWGGANLWQGSVDAHLSPDGKQIFAIKLDGRHAYKLPIMYWLEEKERVDEYLYPLVGEKMPLQEPYLIDADSGEAMLVDGLSKDDYALSFQGWREDGAEAWVVRMNRPRNAMELLALDSASGAIRPVFSDSNDTFLDGPFTGGPKALHILSPGEGFVYLSERTGWRQIYRYDGSGALIGQLTDGEFPVREILEIDEKGGFVYYLRPVDKARPYDRILYRVALSGGAPERLIDADGQHQVVFAEDASSFIVAHSTIERPPVYELRLADGTLVKTFSFMDATKFPKRWAPAKEFVVKARDGETDLHGVIMYPDGFDPEKAYSVVEMVYGGMQADLMPHGFLETGIAGNNGYGILARMVTYAGFITIHINSYGIRGRGKAFHDAAYGTWPQGVVEEHAHVIRQLAKDRPYMDLDRVGITGGSWGGYMTLRAMLYENDLFKVGAAISPVAAHDQTLFFPEAFLGLIEDNPEAYEEGSLFDKAKHLEGDLMIIAGPLDVNANFAHTMKFIDALIEANKPYALHVMPGMNHSMSCCGAMRGIYNQARVIHFLQERL